VASVFARLPAGEPARLSVRLRVPPAFLPQSIGVDVDGAPVGEWRIETAGPVERTLAIPGARITDPVTAVSFRPRRHQAPGGAVAAAAFELESFQLEPER
jgi:hypothetical protein